MSDYLWWLLFLLGTLAAFGVLVGLAAAALIAAWATARITGRRWRARRPTCELCLRIVRVRDRRRHRAACQLLAGAARAKAEHLLDDLGIPYDQPAGEHGPRWTDVDAAAADRWIRQVRRTDPVRR